MKNQEKFQAPRGSLYIPGGRSGILLIHSLGGSPLEMKAVAHAMSRKGMTVYCPVVPGLTFGTDISGLSTWQDWYKSVAAAFDHMRTVCDNIIIGGASAGSILALRLAAYRQDQACGLMLFAPTLSVNGWAIPKTIKLFHLVTDKWTARLFKFRTPAPYGIKDERVRNTMALQRKLGGLVEVSVLDDSYHLVTLDRQRGYVVDRSAEFVDRLLARQADKVAVQKAVSNSNSKQLGAAE
jgi:carboxylesterase